MKKLLSLLFAILFCVPSAAAFSDVESSEYHDAIELLEAADIVEGYADGTFRPTQTINRAEFTKILIAANYDDPSGSHCFSDVKNDWYAPYVCTAKNRGIVDGYTDGSFKPGSSINVAEALKILLETYEIDVCENCGSVWYEPYYEKAEDMDLIDDMSPSQHLTRGEMAQLIYTLLHEQVFGFWGVTGDYNAMANQTGMNAFVVSTSPGYALNTQLPEVDAADLTAAFRMSGGHDKLVDSRGNFSVSAWKTLVDAWVSPELDAYLGDELAWHMLLDDVDIFDDEFGGENPTASDMAELAAYSKSLFPTLKTFIRHDADDMPAGDYPHLDATLNQYTARKGNIDDYIESNLAAAEALGTQSIWGLNIIDGGDGSSGQPGRIAGRYIMSPEEIEEYGMRLLEVPDSLGLFLWEWDADYFDSEEYLAVFAKLAEKAAYK